VAGDARPPSSSPGPLDYLPSRLPALLYLGFAHACLAAAFALVARDPAGLGGFYYHPRLIAVVHLVTLGWIGASVQGAIYLVGPLALRFPLPAGKLDVAAFVGFAVGVLGMASHFWIDSYRGMTWSAILVTLAFAGVGFRVARGLRGAPVPSEVKLHVLLAFVNVLLVSGLGILLGVNKVAAFLPFAQLRGALAHAHLAVLGFGTMIVMGAGYRLLPMILPAAMPRGAWAYASAVLLQAGALGVAAALLTDRGLALAAAVSVAALLAFFTRVAWMLRHPRPAPPARPRPDVGVLHALQSLVYLGLTAAAGLVLVLGPAADWSLRLSMAYGVFALVGFLSQIVVGVESRLLPMVAWLWSHADGEFRSAPPPMHGLASRPLAVAVLVLWTSGVPLLAGGLALDRSALLGAGAAGLCLAVVLNALGAGVVLTRSRRRTG
jgi:hypothetical protein